MAARSLRSIASRTFSKIYGLAGLRVGYGVAHPELIRLMNQPRSPFNVNLPAQVAAGAFRADLLDRLAFDVVTLPPLRARPDDIPLLAQHFAQAMSRALGRPFAGFAPSAERLLLDHD